MKRICGISLLLLAVFALTGSITYAGENMFSRQDDLNSLKMSYRLEGAYSPYKYIQIDILGTGEGKLNYELYKEFVAKGQEKVQTITFKIDEAMLKRFAALHREVDFLNLQLIDLNQDKIQVTDVGTTTLSYSYQGKERTLSYGYVEDNPLKELISLYWQLIDKHLPKQENLAQD